MGKRRFGTVRILKGEQFIPPLSVLDNRPVALNEHFFAIKDGFLWLLSSHYPSVLMENAPVEKHRERIKQRSKKRISDKLLVEPQINHGMTFVNRGEGGHYACFISNVILP